MPYNSLGSLLLADAGKPNGQTICYSDTHGATWKVAHTDGQDATEGEVVELFPPKVAVGETVILLTPPTHPY